MPTLKNWKNIELGKGLKAMTNEKKELKIEFAPGAFDHFEGTQEELDELVAEVQKMFATKTPEEIEAMSRPLSEEDFQELPDEVKEQLAHGILHAWGDDEDLEQEFKRKLQ